MNSHTSFAALVQAMRCDRRPISLRAYVPTPTVRKAARKAKKHLAPSPYTLVFDTETTTDPSQRLRFGFYQIRKGAELFQAGAFYDADAMSPTELALMQAFAKDSDIECMPVGAFINDVFYGIAFDLRASFVGFNLPFDLSRLATRHGLARGKMKGGLKFQLSDDKRRPHLQIKHLSSKSALIQFAGVFKRTDTRGMRRRGIAPPVRRGAFVDLKTIAAALTSQSFTLASLADFLATVTRKAKTNEHGKALTADYLRYAMQDVQVTWECFVALREKYENHNLKGSLISQIMSEAGLGKAYFKEMGIRPWQTVQPDFPASMIGNIIATYFGGRTEVHIRRQVARVLYCDFLSMYPTVCTLMGLWRFAIASGMSYRDTTAETTAWLAAAIPADLQKPDNWRKLTTIVQIKPDFDILAVRAHYENEASATIGLNYLTTDQPVWITLADCIVTKILGGKTPTIAKAITFEANEPQSGLSAVRIAGADGPLVDPLTDDFFRRVIDLRTATKARMQGAKGHQYAQLNAEQQALKILANSTSYGIFIEMNVEELSEKLRRDCFYGAEQSFPIGTDKSENPGSYFHPLLATLITGAARLMLALSERAIIDAGLDWAFCDTDSMAIAKPDGMEEAEFLQRAKDVCDWFLPLNPYEKKGPLLKIEDNNYGIGSEKITPLYSLAISSKRYVLFNLNDEGLPVIRKASAHGLGHLLDPYGEDDAPAGIPAPSVALSEIGVRRWQYDLWFKIIQAACSDTPAMVPLDYHPALRNPAVSRYAATTPQLLRWFKQYNVGRPYCDQVKPFNFMCALQAKLDAQIATLYGKAASRRRPLLKPIAPYFPNTAIAARHCFDRDTGHPIAPAMLQTYQEALVRYHLSPESKFENGNYHDRGITRRRHVHATQIRLIGKEANKWEEQSVLGISAEANVEYGFSPDTERVIQEILQKAALSQRALADYSGISRTTIRKIKNTSKQRLRPMSIAAFNSGVSKINAENENYRQLCELAKIEIARIGIAELARRVEYDASNLYKVVKGERKLSRCLISKLSAYFKR